ncbi:Uncharacterised protein [uncultured Clostridium sp.]|nr:Uncharacterised protein [uncultured Clostridium sp.]
MEFMGIKGDRPEGAADGQFCTRRKCRRLRCGVLAAVLAAGLCLSGCQGKNVETMAAFAEKEGTEDGTGAADSVDGEFGMSNESEAETTVDGDTAANPGASTGSVEDAATVKELNRVKVKGIYVSGPMAGTAGMDNLIALVDRTELNALVIDVKNDDGYLTCELDVPLAEQIGSEKHYIKDLPALVQTCKEKNIYLIARVVAFKDPILAEKMPEWSLHNSDGSIFRDKSGLAWVNPYRKEVWEYLASVGEAAIKAGFDEVQYDYVRFSTDSRMKQVDFGDSTKGRTKTEAISGFTLYASERIHAAGGRISADVYGVVIDSEEDQQIVGQNYVEMSRSLDAISPMIYPSHYGPYNYQIPVPDAQPYDTVLAAMQASKMVLAGLDPKTGKKPVSADVSGNDAVDAAIVGGEAVSGNNAADTAADSQSTSGTTAVSGNDAVQNAENAQAADGAQVAEDAAAKTPALSKEEIAQLDPTTGVQATVRPWLQDFTATWVKGHISYGPEEIRAQIQAVYDAGYEEWILWNAANRYTEGGLLTQEEEVQ